MESIDKRKPRTFSMSEREYSSIELVMDYYRLRSVSAAIRFLVIRESARIAGIEVESAGNNGDL